MIYLWGMEETITYHTCSICGEKKPLTEEYFYERKDTKFGWRKECKDCKKKNRNLERVRIYSKTEKARNCRKRYNEKHKDLISERNKIRRSKMTEEQKSQKLKLKKLWIKRQSETNNLFVISTRIRSTLKRSFSRKGWSKKTKTQLYLDCDWETFMKHIENQFVDGMSWDNYGEWHYDHIYPLSLAQTEEDMFIFNHYTNFQPLWAEDNLSKSDSVPDGFEEWYEMMKEKVNGN